MGKKQIKTWGFGLAGVVLFLGMLLLPPPTSLEVAAAAQGGNGNAAMAALGVLLWGICWWIGGVMPDWCTALGMQCLWVLCGGLDFTTVFAGYSGSTIWLIIGAFTLGNAITKTGLLTRISLGLMQLFPATFRGQVAAMLTVGVVCAPLLPSSTAKVVLGTRLAGNSASLMGFDSHTPGRDGLFLSAWTGFFLAGPMFLSASFLAYSVLSVLPSEYARVSWIQWFAAMLPWGIMMLLGMLLTIFLGYRPEKQGSFSQEEIRRQRLALGTISRQEGMTLVILIVCLSLWILENATGFNAGVVAVLGAICCYGLGILEKKEIASATPWGFILFMGVTLNMGRIFSVTGLSGWLLTWIQPFFTGTSGPEMVICLVTVISLALRFIIASQTAVLPLLTGILVPVALATGMNPLIIGLVVYTATSCWMVPYQNPSYVAALESVGGTVSHSHMAKSAVLYSLISLAATLASIPYWTWLGYIH